MPTDNRRGRTRHGDRGSRQASRRENTSRASAPVSTQWIMRSARRPPECSLRLRHPRSHGPTRNSRPVVPAILHPKPSGQRVDRRCPPAKPSRHSWRPAARDLPSPVLISAKPALARGTRNIRRRQKAAEVWEKPGSVTLVPHRGRDEPEPPEPDPIARRRFPPAQMRFAPEPNGGAPSWTGRSPIRPKGAENPQASCDSVKEVETV